MNSNSYIFSSTFDTLLYTSKNVYYRIWCIWVRYQINKYPEESEKVTNLAFFSYKIFVIFNKFIQIISWLNIERIPAKPLLINHEALGPRGTNFGKPSSKIRRWKYWSFYWYMMGEIKMGKWIKILGFSVNINSKSNMSSLS